MVSLVMKFNIVSLKGIFSEIYFRPCERNVVAHTNITFIVQSGFLPLLYSTIYYWILIKKRLLTFLSNHFLKMPIWNCFSFSRVWYNARNGAKFLNLTQSVVLSTEVDQTDNSIQITFSLILKTRGRDHCDKQYILKYLQLLSSIREMELELCIHTLTCPQFVLTSMPGA
jgi:hypothetical protein